MSRAARRTSGYPINLAPYVGGDGNIFVVLDNEADPETYLSLTLLETKELIAKLNSTLAEAMARLEAVKT